MYVWQFKCCFSVYSNGCSQLLTSSCVLWIDDHRWSSGGFNRGCSSGWDTWSCGIHAIAAAAARGTRGALAVPQPSRQRGKLRLTYFRVCCIHRAGTHKSIVCSMINFDRHLWMQMVFLNATYASRNCRLKIVGIVHAVRWATMQHSLQM